MRLAAKVVVSVFFLQLSVMVCRAEDSSAKGGSEEIVSPDDAWKRAMELGEDALARGEYAEALGHFLTADAVDFPEIPSYEALPRIAEARCHLGDRATGQAILADLRCILDIEAGVAPCYVGEETRGAPGHPNPELTPLCFERMCGEIFLAYYDSPSEAQLAEIEALRTELDRLRRLCDDEPPE